MLFLIPQNENDNRKAGKRTMLFLHLTHIHTPTHTHNAQEKSFRVNPTIF